MLVLTGINNLVSKSELCKQRFDLIGGVDEIDLLQLSQYYEIYKLAADILEKVYGLE